MKNSIILSIILFAISTCNLQAQTHVNREWETSNGNPLGLEWSSSITNSSNQLISVGNTNVSGQGANILTTKFNKEGVILWQKVFNTFNSNNDYGVAVSDDNLGNIYVAGTTDNSTLTNFDVVILKYNSTGTLLWSAFYNSAFNLNDIATSIKIDDNGNVFVGATSLGTTTNFDFLALKFNSSGVLQWSSRYDFASLIEIPISIDIDNLGNVFLSGASASSTNNWDYTIAKFSQIGNYLGDVRNSLPGLGLDQPLAYKKDDNGNIYITGRTSSDGTNYNIRTIKLDQNYLLQWSKVFDFNGKEDIANAIDVDANGNVIIGGYVTNSSNIKEMFALKYNSSGNEMWQHRQSGADATSDAFIKALQTKQNGEIYFVGEEKGTNGTRDAVVSKIDNAGDLAWQKKISDNFDNKPSTIKVSNDGSVYVTTLKDSSLIQYETIKYSEKEKPFDIVFLNGIASHNKNEVIIRFDRSSIVYSTIDKKEFEAGELQNFIQPNVISAMNNKLGFDVRKLPTFKIFKRMTTADTVSVTRLGEEIKIEDFWATLSVFFPENFLEQQIADSLAELFPVVHYAEPNFVGKLTSASNDPIYSNQFPNGQTGLNSPMYGIEVEKCWERQVGQPYVKVGVFDSGINWRHEDFGNGTWAGSKANGGWDFASDNDPANQINPDGNGHGTAIAGIIGAIRNNNLGVSGIAGGNFSLNQNTGCALYSLKITQGGSVFATMEIIANAIVEGASNNPNSEFGFGLHIQNHSWATKHDSQILKAAVRICNKNSCLFVASSGNIFDDVCDGDVECISYPSCYNDSWILKVGANDETGSAASLSVQGNNLDVVAPGVSEIYATLDHNNDSSYSYNGDGTSFAAPHGAGVAALLCSEHNINNGYPNNLAPEDIEAFINSFKTDIPPIGYDQATGFGRINADYAMEKIMLPKYFVKHSGGLVSQNPVIESNLNVFVSTNIFDVSPGYYLADRYAFTTTFVDVFNSNQASISFWPRFSSSAGVSSNLEINGETSFSFTESYNQNISTITTTTYAFHILQSLLQIVDKWIPAPPNQIKTAYSLYVRDNSITNIENNEKDEYCNIYPNPFNNTLFISFDLQNSSEVYLEVIDAIGQLVLAENLGNKNKGNNIINMNFSNLNTGMYLCKIKFGKEIVTKRIIKN